jgi:hypothetical protein
MRNDCVFKKFDSNKSNCIFPAKIIKRCCFCDKYLPNNGELDDNLKYISYVVQRNNNRKAFNVSLIAIIVSICALLVNFLKLFEGK